MTLQPDRGAEISACQRYRYNLWRQVGPERRTAVFILLNPSTADALADDPTVLRCMHRAALWGYGRVEIVNLFALRSTDPGALRTEPDPVGEENDAAIKQAIERADIVVCGWGSNNPDRERARQVLALVRDAGKMPCALKINNDGTPGHPLYLGYDLPPCPIPGWAPAVPKIRHASADTVARSSPAVPR